MCVCLCVRACARVHGIESGGTRRRSACGSREGGLGRGPWVLVRRRRPGEASRWMAFAAALSPSPANGPLIALLYRRLHQPSRSSVTWRLVRPAEWVTGRMSQEVEGVRWGGDDPTPHLSVVWVVRGVKMILSRSEDNAPELGSSGSVLRSCPLRWVTGYPAPGTGLLEACSLAPWRKWEACIALALRATDSYF